MLPEDAKWHKVSLRLFGDGLDPAKVEGLIGLRPTNVGIKGKRRKGQQGREYAAYESNLWVYSHDAPETSCFEEQLRELFALLGQKLSVLKTLCSTPGIEGELFLGFSSGSGQGGVTLLPETLSLIADTGLSLSFDLYPPTVDEEDDDDPPYRK